MYRVVAGHHFDSAHYLRGYQGKCSRLHGHRWEVEAEIRGEELNPLGMLIDFSILKKLLREVAEPLDHQNLSEISPFDTINPTAENIAGYIYHQMKDKMTPDTLPPKACLYKVTVWESPECRAEYSEK